MQVERNQIAESQTGCQHSVCGIIEEVAGPGSIRAQRARPRLIRCREMRRQVVDRLTHSTKWAVCRNDHGANLADLHLSPRRALSIAPSHLPFDQVRLYVVYRAFVCLPCNAALSFHRITPTLDRAEQERPRCTTRALHDPGGKLSQG